MGLKAELTFLHFQFVQILEVRPFDILQEEPFEGLNRFFIQKVQNFDPLSRVDQNDPLYF